MLIDVNISITRPVPFVRLYTQIVALCEGVSVSQSIWPSQSFVAVLLVAATWARWWLDWEERARPRRAWNARSLGRTEMSSLFTIVPWGRQKRGRSSLRIHLVGDHVLSALQEIRSDWQSTHCYNYKFAFGAACKIWRAGDKCQVHHIHPSSHACKSY